MANVSMQQNGDACAAIGPVYRYEPSFTIALGGGGTSFVGFVTPPTGNIRVLGRSYSSSDSPLTIELIEATFTGGSATRTLNRNLTLPVNPPVTMLTNVTPGTLGPVITGVTLRSSPVLLGTSQVSIAGDTNTLILKPNTSYVIRFTNGGGLNAQIAAGIDLRLALPSDYVTLKPNEI